MYAFGSTIESWTNASSGWFALFAYATRLSRSGPTLPVAFAALSVWQLEQPLALKTERPAADDDVVVVVEVVEVVVDEGGAAVFPCFLSQESNAAGSITIVRDRIRDLIKTGSTLDQIKATSPTRGYTRRYGSDSGPWTTNNFVEAIYQSLVAERKRDSAQP